MHSITIVMSFVSTRCHWGFVNYDVHQQYVHYFILVHLVIAVLIELAGFSPNLVLPMPLTHSQILEDITLSDASLLITWLLQAKWTPSPPHFGRLLPFWWYFSVESIAVRCSQQAQWGVDHRDRPLWQPCWTHQGFPPWGQTAIKAYEYWNVRKFALHTTPIKLFVIIVVDKCKNKVCKWYWWDKTLHKSWYVHGTRVRTQLDSSLVACAPEWPELKSANNCNCRAHSFSFGWIWLAGYLYLLVFANELRISGPPFPLGVHLVLLLLHLPLLHQHHLPPGHRHHLPVSPDLKHQPVMKEEEEGEDKTHMCVNLEHIKDGWQGQFRRSRSKSKEMATVSNLVSDYQSCHYP